LQGAQLPPVTLEPVDGIKFFPDQPSISDSELSSGIAGARQDSIAIVPTRPGQLTLPEIRIPWWDTQAGELRFAVIPARTLEVAAAQAIEDPTSGQAFNDRLATQPGPGASAGGSSLLWQLVALFCALGWAVTVLVLWRGKKPARAGAAPEKESLSLTKAHKQLLAACASNNAILTRAALLSWSDAISGKGTLSSLKEVKALFEDTELNREIDNLERSLYSKSPSGWSGASMAEQVKRLHRQAREQTAKARDKLTLYPSGA
jgi:hypothetical protein